MGIGMVVVHGYTWQNMAIQGYGDIWQYIGIHGIIKNWTTDFQPFYWLVRHRLSVHIPAVSNMVKEHVSNKASWKHLWSFKKKCAQKPFWTGIKSSWNKIIMEDPGVFNKTIILLGLLATKWLQLICLYATRWLPITSYPGFPRRIIVEYMVINGNTW